MQESRAVQRATTAWTTTRHKKTEEIISDANAKPVALPAGTVVAVKRVLVDVEPRSLLVETSDGRILEVREHALAPL